MPNIIEETILGERGIRCLLSAVVPLVYIRDEVYVVDIPV